MTPRVGKILVEQVHSATKLVKRFDLVRQLCRDRSGNCNLRCHFGNHNVQSTTTFTLWTCTLFFLSFAHTLVFHLLHLCDWSRLFACRVDLFYEVTILARYQLVTRHLGVFKMKKVPETGTGSKSFSWKPRLWHPLQCQIDWLIGMWLIPSGAYIGFFDVLQVIVYILCTCTRGN